MKEFFIPLPKYGMMGGMMSGPYVGSLTTLVFIFCSAFLILYFDRGWIVPLCLILLLGTWAGLDWNKPHGQVAKKVYYQKDNLIVPKWIFNMNRKLSAYCKQQNFEYKHSFYRCWITAKGKTWLMYTFPRIPWSKTVIGFEDPQAKKFYLKLLAEVYRVENTGARPAKSQ